MVSTIRFDRASRDRVFDDLARIIDPQRVHIALEGDVHDLAIDVDLEIADGRLIIAKSGSVTGARAMLRLALASNGELTLITSARPAQPLESYPRLVGQLAEAEASAMTLSGMLASCGGLDGVLAADLNALMTQLATLPDAASSVLRLADGSRTVAAILRDSPHDEMLTARILQRLVSSSLLTLSSTDAESLIVSVRSDEPQRPTAQKATAFETAYDSMSVLPTEDELEGAGVEADVHHWLENEQAPEALLSDAGFTEAFTQPPRSAPRPGPQPPRPPPVSMPSRPAARPALEAPLPLPEEQDEEQDSAVLEQAGLESRSPNRAILIGALVALAFVILLMSRRSGHKDEEEETNIPPVVTSTRAPTPPVLAITATKTATVATSTPAVSRALVTLRTAPPIAGPDAPEEVRRAESLLNDGKYAEAGKLLDALRAKRANDPAVWVLSGQHAVDSGGKLSIASERAEHALSIDPKFYRAWVLKGSVLQFLGKRKQAAEAYNRAVKLEPDHAMSPELRTIVDGLEKS